MKKYWEPIGVICFLMGMIGAVIFAQTQKPALKKKLTPSDTSVVGKNATR